jgi:hypothetical protein
MKRVLIWPVIQVLGWTCWIIDWPPLNKRLPSAIRRLGCPNGLGEMALRLEDRYSPRQGAGKEV